MPHADPVLVFDLDGTILRVNSFPLWAIDMLAGRVSGLPWRQRLRLSFATQSLLFGRKLRRADHDALLAGLQEAWRSACGDAVGQASDRFANRLLRHVRPVLGPMLELVARGDADAVLATAAAEDYAQFVGRALGFRHIIAARAGNGGGNRGPRKRDAVLALLREQGWSRRPLLFLTDHLDDLPLIKASTTVCWFGSKRDIPAIRAAAPGVAIVFAEGLDAALPGFRTLRPHLPASRPSTVS
jgi:phosphoserine phosphatase